jgi:hypothetical protein
MGASQTSTRQHNLPQRERMNLGREKYGFRKFFNNSKRMIIDIPSLHAFNGGY